MRLFYVSALMASVLLINISVKAQETSEKERRLNCTADNHPCIFYMLENMANNIDNDRWREQTYRETAKLLSHSSQTDQALLLLKKVKNPDTKAMTIRGIGMAAAEAAAGSPETQKLFTSLIEEAEKISHPPSRAIALRYIAKAQALANQDEDAWRTSQAILNNSQKDKAFEEIAEVQAKKFKKTESLGSIAKIEDLSYRNRAYYAVSKIFSGQQRYDDALDTAMHIKNNPYLKAQSLLYILTEQITPEDVSAQ